MHNKKLKKKNSSLLGYGKIVSHANCDLAAILITDLVRAMVTQALSVAVIVVVLLLLMTALNSAAEIPSADSLLCLLKSLLRCSTEV